MKKIFAMLLACMLVFSLVACGGNDAPAGDQAADTTEITLWTYPVGKFGDEATVKGFIEKFNAVHPEITVKVEYLDYTNGDNQVTAALEAGTAPDIILEGPERLVSNWGRKGKMVDISDLWADTKADIEAQSPAVVAACQENGVFYEYPFCMTTHCMAINYEVFEQAGALQYLDLETRTWTTENFKKALEAVAGSGLVQETGVVYCGGQGGDQGTRALVNNLYSGKFTNEDYTLYTADSAENVKALTELKAYTDAGILSYDAGIVAADELQLFANGTIGMSFCWNAANEANYASQVQFTPYAMAFPSDDGTPELCGGIWGFGIFNNEDDAKIAAAKTFIKFICDDETQGKESVKATGFFPVKASYGNVYAGTEDEARMGNYTSMMPYLGAYYNVAPNWAEQRTAWWGMLQEVFAGTAVEQAVATYTGAVNK
ncbi:MAG: extracellular solute-binding protein [Lachnospiraceae bacterium]|nr:extracellular solute-binding protein [Lachnospiraceae bacterium]